MPCTNREVAVTTRELEDPARLVGRPAAASYESGHPVIIHANITPERTPPLADSKLFAAVLPVVILDAALAWTFQVLAAFAFCQAVVVVVVVVQVLVPEVVNEDVPNSAVRKHLLRQVDNAVPDDVGIDATDVVRLVAADHSIVTVELVHLELAQLVGFHHLVSVLDECVLDRKVDPEFSVCRVIEVTFEFMQLLEVGIPAIFERFKFDSGYLDLLVANKLYSRIWVLVAAGVDIAFFVGDEFTLHQVLGGLGPG